MERIKDFASRWPSSFAILLILSSLVITNLAAILIIVLFRVDQANPILAPIGSLTGTLLLVFLLWRFGWLKAAGVASLGSWKGWIVALVLLTYYLLELTYSFFGEFSFDIPTEAVRGLRVTSIFIGAMFEEILFRGAILYALVRVWGTIKKGILIATIVSALLFGVIHAANAISGDINEVPGQIAIALVEGLWWAAIVLRWGSVWPVVFIHAITNWALQTKALSFIDYHGTASAYALAVLLGLPLAALGVWWILRAKLGYHHQDSSSHELSAEGVRGPNSASS